MLEEHDAASDAAMTAMMHAALADLKARDVRIPRRLSSGFTTFAGG